MDIRKSFAAIFLVAVFSISMIANATLITRLGGQAYYDDQLNITWLADANYAQTSGYDLDGRMTWDDAQTWISTLNVSNYLGFSNWRLPITNPVNGSTFDYNFSFDGTTDRGYNISAIGTSFAGSIGSEMANLSFSALGNIAWYDPTGNGPQTGWGLSNTGPFSNIKTDFYWSNTEYAPYPPSDAWKFRFYNGLQSKDWKDNSLYYAWAVLDGDVAAVPEPHMLWLFGSGLIGLIGFARRKQNT